MYIDVTIVKDFFLRGGVAYPTNIKFVVTDLHKKRV